MSDDLIRRGDAMHIVEGWRVLEDDIEALPAATAFTAADLERAWGMGRDEAARAVHEAGRMTLGHLNAIGGLTPPTDLAQRVKEG